MSNQEKPNPIHTPAGAQKYTRVPSQPVCAKGGLWPYPCSGRLTLQKNGWMKGSFLCEEHAGYALRHPPLESPAEAPTYVEALPRTGHYSDPTRAMLDDPIWNAIWEEIKTWDVNVPGEYGGYCGATGNHATAIFLAIQLALQPAAPSGAAEAQKPPCRCEQPYEAHANLPLRSRRRDGRKVTCFIYHGAEAQAVKPAPSAPDGSQVGQPICEEAIPEDLKTLYHGCKNGFMMQGWQGKNLIEHIAALRTENASLLAAVNAAKIVALEKAVEQAKRDLELKDGAIRAQDEREKQAAAKAGMIWNCDWPDEAAELILYQEKRLDAVYEDARREGLEQAADSIRTSLSRILGRDVEGKRRRSECLTCHPHSTEPDGAG